jgi:N-acetylmuramoyl-L-alanine amidase
MRWIKALPASTSLQPIFALIRLRFRPFASLLGLAFILLIGLGSAIWRSGDSSDQKVISVYSPVANYSLPLSQRDNRDFVGLFELLEPLGTVSSRTEAQNWKLHFNGIEAVFPNGSTRVRVRGHDVDLPARFLLENGRGLVPIDSLMTLLPQFLGISVTFRASARRLFIRESGTTYTAQFTGGNSPKLVLNFTSPVNPKIATEPGKLRMAFTRDPVIASAAPTVSFNSSAISSAGFVESNGTAELTVSGGVPLLASFGNDGRTITITPAPSAPPASAMATASTPSNVSPASATPSPAPAITPPTAAQPPAGTPTFVVIDPSHGGTESGATFSSTLVEKDVTLAFARVLRQEFVAKGFTAMLLRDADTLLTTDQRAATANAARPAIYISVHAASDGKGTRLYTALLSPSLPNDEPLVAWDRAQLKSLTSSQAAAARIGAELGKVMPTRTMSANLRPLPNVVASAIAIEVAPRNGDVADLAAGDYQQQVATAVVAGVGTIRDKLEGAR